MGRLLWLLELGRYRAEVTRPVFREFDSVRVVKLRGAAASHLAGATAQRPPRLGDVGTVAEVRRTGEPASRYLVEAVTGEGETIWLAEFAADELQLEAEFERG